MDSRGSDRTQGQPSHILRKMFIARTANTKPGVQYRDRRTIYTQAHTTTDLSTRCVHVHAGRKAPGNKFIKPLERALQDAGFLARVIRRYSQGATSGN